MNAVDVIVASRVLGITTPTVETLREVMRELNWLNAENRILRGRLSRAEAELDATKAKLRAALWRHRERTIRFLPQLEPRPATLWLP